MGLTLLGLLTGAVLGWALAPEAEQPPGVLIDCERSFSTYSASRLENGDVVALLGELETTAEVLEHIRERERDFLFDAESLYCLAQASVPLEVLREMLGPYEEEDTPTKTVVHRPKKKAKSTGVVLPEDSPIVLRLKREVHTKRISVGQSVPFEVVEPVQAHGVTVISRGTPVYAEVTKARKGRIMGKAAELELNFSTVRAVDGQLLKLDVYRDWTANSKKEAVTTMNELEAELRADHDKKKEIPEAFKLGVFIRGRNIILPAGTTLTIASEEPYRVQATGS